MQYLITTLTIRTTDKGQTAPGERKQEWVATYSSRTEAMKHYESLQSDPSCIAAVVTAWTPGQLEPDRSLPHGNNSTRGCAGGIPTETVVAAGSRIHQAWTSTAWFSVSGPWSEDAEDVGREVSTQPPGSFVLRSKPAPTDDWGMKELHRRYVAARPAESDERIAQAIGYSREYVKSLR